MLGIVDNGASIRLCSDGCQDFWGATWIGLGVSLRQRKAKGLPLGVPGAPVDRPTQVRWFQDTVSERKVKRTPVDVWPKTRENQNGPFFSSFGSFSCMNSQTGHKSTINSHSHLFV